MKILPGVIHYIALLFSVLIVFSSCKDKEFQDNHSIKFNMIDRDLCKQIAGKRIFFGHQSVGYNIIEGIESIRNENCPDNITISESRSIDSLGTPIFAHARIGENLNPKGKIDDFVILMRNGLADSLDIACLKLCYVDITRNTDILELFSYYKSAFEKVQKEFPGTIFVHMTVPLTTKATGPKGLIKRMIGYDHNINRNRYNELLRDTYSEEILFDIALIESTYPDGTREKGPGKSFALVPGLSFDEGHLNAMGSKLVAEQFLNFLANSCKN